MTENAVGPDRRSWWAKVFGRSLLKAVVGDFFNQERNAASVIAIAIVGTLCYAAIVMQNSTAMSTLSNLIFAVVGYYFGTKGSASKEADE